MAAGIITGGACDIIRLRAEVADQVGSVPEAGTVTFDPWRVTVRTAGDQTFLCAASADTPARCASSADGPVFSTVIDRDTYRVFATSSAADLRISRSTMVKIDSPPASGPYGTPSHQEAEVPVDSQVADIGG